MESETVYLDDVLMDVDIMFYRGNADFHALRMNLDKLVLLKSQETAWARQNAFAYIASCWRPNGARYRLHIINEYAGRIMTAMLDIACDPFEDECRSYELIQYLSQVRKKHFPAHRLQNRAEAVGKGMYIVNSLIEERAGITQPAYDNMLYQSAAA